MKINIIAIDPGKSTGVAFLTGNDNFVVHSSLEMWHGNVARWLRGALNFHKGEDHQVIVAMEQFITGTRTRGHTVQNHASELFGVVKQMCEDEGFEFAPQMAADAKKIAPDRRLRVLNMYHVGEGHDNDATRHALLCLMRKFPATYYKLLKDNGEVEDGAQ